MTTLDELREMRERLEKARDKAATHNSAAWLAYEISYVLEALLSALEKESAE